MYGGVATPLALLHHSDVNDGRLKHTHPQSSTNHSNREETYGISRNVLRLPPLRETGSHRGGGGSDHISGCENEPLLPNVTCKLPRNGKKLPSLEDTLPPPPLPPHKNNNINNNNNNCLRQDAMPEMKYNPPWPR